jgi:hypothetical protein
VHMPMKDVGFRSDKSTRVSGVCLVETKKVPTTKFDFANVDMTLQRKGRALSLGSLYKPNKTIHS